MKKEYNADSVQVLTFREGVRKRVGMYLGSPDMEGVYNGLFEIISNSVDEAIVGFGKKINIRIGKNFATVQDFGRGIPRGPKGNDPEVLITLLTQSHSGAKFDDDSYQSVRGLNGIGSGATNCSSDKFTVVTQRDGYSWSLEFKDGIPLTPTAVKGVATTTTGTAITFYPSQEVFASEKIEFDYEVVSKKVKDMSYLVPGITFTVYNVDTNENREFLSTRGILDLLDDVVKEPLTKSIIFAKAEDKNNKVEVCLKWSKKGHSERSYVFVNGAECPEGGSPLTGFKTAITRTLNKEFKKDFSGELVRRGLTYAISCSVKAPQFANQTKTKITNAELRGLADKAFTEAWRDFSLKNPKEVELVKEFLAKEDKADAAADRARNAIINSTREIEIATKKKTYNVEKLKDCLDHGPESTLLICEGKSASGALQTARPIKDVALYAIRGKIINAKTNLIEKVLENEEVKDLITIIGAGIFEKFNEKKMNFGKIGMAVDADADGYNIACLIMVLFDTLMPGLIEAGHLYWLKTPFYEITQGGKTYYFETDVELKEWEKQNAGKKFAIKRNKGLGSLSDKAKKEGIFDNPDSLVRLTMSDVSMAKAQLENLMGENVDFRKEFIYNNIDFSKIIE